MRFLKNRILISLVVIFGAAYAWEFYIKPTTGVLYTAAVSEYKNRNYDRSLDLLQKAYRIDPNDSAILRLLGWNYLKKGDYSHAEANFSRALRLNPKLDDARMGLAYCWLEMGETQKALEYFQQLPAADQRSPAIRTAMARAHRLLGDNQTALRLARGVLRENKEDKLARKELALLTGSEDVGAVEATHAESLPRPSSLMVPARARNESFELLREGSWKRIYIAGVDIGPATPGHFASEPPTEVNVYLDWLDKVGEMGANSVRVYTILPPAFYQALKQHNDASRFAKLYLFQEIWLGGGEETDLFSPSKEGAAREEIARAIDVIHGQGDLPMRRGYSSGVYFADVSGYVLGILIGREMPPHWVLSNNQANAPRTSYAGKYVSVASGNPTEAWLASVMDYAVSYETEKYNCQHPIAFANSPALDPLAHPSESSVAEEVSIRRNQGERTAALPPPNEPIDDNDVVSLNEETFHAEGPFQAGIFSAYSVFPFYPDFMYRDPSYLATRDRQGPNPFLGYLRALKGHYSGMPLLIAEYGIPTSIGISHIHPLGWNDGGATENEQADLLARLTKTIGEAGCAGGLLFEWQDEWYRADWLAGALALPPDRRPLWNNRLDPSQGFGLWTYDPGATARLFTEFSGWDSVRRLYQKDAGPTIQLNDGWDSERTLRSLAASFDEAFLYLRLQVGHVRSILHDLPDLAGAHYYIGISTAAGRFGGRILPALVPRVRSESGVNFLLDLAEDGRARLLIASNYNPREFQPIPWAGSAVQSSYRIPFAPALGEWTGFEEIVVEPNRRRFARDGHAFPAQLNNESLLRYRPPGETSDTEATWSCDFAKNAFIFRLPWELLMVTDPSSHRVFAGTEAGPQFTSLETKGLELFAVSFRASGPIQFQQLRGGGVPAVDSLPGRDAQGSFTGLATYTWPGWNAVKVEGRPKAAYASVQKVIHELRGASP